MDEGGSSNIPKKRGRRRHHSGSESSGSDSRRAAANSKKGKEARSIGNYKDTQDMLYNQKLILNRVQGKKGGIGRGGVGPQAPYIPYDKWHTDQVDWLAMEKSLYGSVTVPEDADEDDDPRDAAYDPSRSE